MRPPRRVGGIVLLALIGPLLAACQPREVPKPKAAAVAVMAVVPRA